MKKMTVETFTADSGCSNWPPEDAAGCVAWFQNLLETVPPEHRNKAKIIISSYTYYGDDYARIEVIITRPETDEEEAERERQEQADKEADRTRELQLLAQLQAKYGEG